jgi:flagellar hook assembly protein FlgD
VFPNPSAGDFFFNFILTGNELPDEFLLEIFTTQGQRLRTFTFDSIQQFNIGTNQLVWDGREATGAYLPRGVYVYRMQVKTPSKETSTQGKLVLMR